ncbi:hypothetical protein [Paenibacillus periandrae]|uniref:hypothetical protein n=1 Tax=Paenibacillus periandrae TaxID=1761741 RepID=UPI001F094232|nr:hypothetical protein [Paenibacillus periandrae]
MVLKKIPYYIIPEEILKHVATYNSIAFKLIYDTIRKNHMDDEEAPFALME